MRKLITLAFTLVLATAVAQKTDATGKKQGYWKKIDPASKKLVYEGEFRNDLPVGKFKYYYPNDSLRAIMNFRDGGKWRMRGCFTSMASAWPRVNTLTVK